MAQFKHLAWDFSKDLEECIREDLRLLVSTRRRTLFPYPNESTLLHLPTSVTTLDTPDGKSINASTMILRNKDVQINCCNSPSEADITTPRLSTSLTVRNPTTRLQNKNSVTLYDLSQGDRVSNYIGSKKVSSVLAAGTLRIHIEHGSGAKRLVYTAK